MSSKSNPPESLHSFMTWTQNYDPFHSAILSPLAAGLPVVLLLGLLATGRIPAPLAAVFGLVAAVAVAILCSRLPAQMSDGPGRWGWASHSVGGGFDRPSALAHRLIVLNAVFLYALTVNQPHLKPSSIQSCLSTPPHPGLAHRLSFWALLRAAGWHGWRSGGLDGGAGFRPRCRRPRSC